MGCKNSKREFVTSTKMSGKEMGTIFDHRTQAKQGVVHVELNLDEQTPNLEEHGTDEETSSSESEGSDDDGSDNDSLLTDEDTGNHIQDDEQDDEDDEVERVRGRRPSEAEEPGLFLINESILTISNLVQQRNTGRGLMFDMQDASLCGTHK
jgi:hypothetical protein